MSPPNPFTAQPYGEADRSQLPAELEQWCRGEVSYFALDQIDGGRQARDQFQAGQLCENWTTAAATGDPGLFWGFVDAGRDYTEVRSVGTLVSFGRSVTGGIATAASLFCGGCTAPAVVYLVTTSTYISAAKTVDTCLLGGDGNCAVAAASTAIGLVSRPVAREITGSEAGRAGIRAGVDVISQVVGRLP